MQYKKDCERVFGRILTNRHVKSSVEGPCPREAAEIWRKSYPDEPFEIDYMTPLSSGDNEEPSSSELETINYDLVSAVKRQSSFYYQVAQIIVTPFPSVLND